MPFIVRQTERALLWDDFDRPGAALFRLVRPQTRPLRSSQALLDLLAMQTVLRVRLDELPNLVETEPAFPGLLQAAWDGKLSRGSLELLVSGSSVSMMEVLSRRGPMFGRRTGQLRLGPLPAGALGEAVPMELRGHYGSGDELGRAGFTGQRERRADECFITPDDLVPGA